MVRQIFDKYNRLGIHARAAFWFTMCSFLQKGISFITVPFFTRLLTTEQYGIYSVYLSWLQIFTVISSLYLYYGVTDNAMSKYEHDRSKYISTMQGLTISITTCVALITILSWGGIKKIFNLAPIYIFLMFVEIYVTPALAFWSARQRFEYKYKRLVGVTLIKSILNPTLGLIAVYFATDKALARVTSTVVVEVLICGAIMVYQFIKGKNFYDRLYWKYALTLAIPMLPHYLSSLILNHGDRIMILNMVGTSEVALYGVAYNIGMLVQLFINAINQAFTPWVYSKLKESDIKPIKERARGIMIFIFLVSIGLMLIGPELILVFGSTKYANAAYVIPPVAGSAFFVFLYSFLSYPEFYYEKTSFLMIASLIAAGLNLLLNYIFIPLFGYVAAAYTTLVCYVIYSLGHYIVSRKILYQTTGEYSTVDGAVTIVLSISLILISLFIYRLFPYMILRYFLIFFVLLIAFIKRDSVIAILGIKK